MAFAYKIFIRHLSIISRNSCTNDFNKQLETHTHITFKNISLINKFKENVFFTFLQFLIPKGSNQPISFNCVLLGKFIKTLYIHF